MFSQGLFLGWVLHMIFSAVALVGAVLFVLWANKLKPAELKKWVTWLLAVGVLGMIVSGAVMGRGQHYRMGDKMMKNGGDMLEMMEDGMMGDL